MSNIMFLSRSNSPEYPHLVTNRQSRRRFQALLSIGLALAGFVAHAGATTPKGYQQTNLLSNGSVDAMVTDKNFINPWGISLSQTFWINANASGLDYVVDPSSGAISFTVHIPPALHSGLGSPTGTVTTTSLPSGSFQLPDKTTPFFLFCALDGTVSGWSGGNVQIAINNSKSNAIYNDMALMTTPKGTFLLLANFGAGADIEVYDDHYEKAMTGLFKDPNVPATYAPYSVHVLDGTVYVTFAPRSVPGYKVNLGSGHGFVDAFDETGKFLSRIIPEGGKLDAPWGMAIAPSTFGVYGGDILVGSFGNGTVSAYDPKQYEFRGQIADDNGNPIANPDLWEIVFGQADPAAGNPDTLYFTAGLNEESAGLFGTITVASSELTKTRTTVTSDGNPETKGSNVTMTALIQPTGGSGEPEGIVSFSVDGKPFLKERVDSTAHASITTDALAVGKHTVTATYSGDANFGTSSGSFTEVIETPSAAAPVFTPAVGTYSTAQTISISDATPHAKIYYTTDGETPSTKSTVYTKPFGISKTTTVKAIAGASGLADSAASSASYTIDLNATATPTFSLASGNFIGNQLLTIADTSKGAVIYYTVDGSTPTTGSTIYSKAISVTKTTTVKAIALAPDLTQSAVVSAVYTISAPSSPTATPTFSPVAGYYTSAQSVTLADTTSGATIYYTTDGTTPTTNSPVYRQPIGVSATTTIKAIALAPGSTPSTVVTGAFTIYIYSY
jgi:uncharacterized protein (TIGR03118 family)